MGQFLPYLLYLLCPLSLGAMAWMMMRGTGTGNRNDTRIAELESQFAELRSSQREKPAEVAGPGR